MKLDDEAGAFTIVMFLIVIFLIAFALAYAMVYGNMLVDSVNSDVEKGIASQQTVDFVGIASFLLAGSPFFALGAGIIWLYRCSVNVSRGDR